jgi:hypothetical protein
MGDELK